MGMRLLFCGDENVPKVTVEMVAQVCEYPKNDERVHFKWVDIMVCELHLHKAVISRKIKQNKRFEIGKGELIF